MGDASCPCCGEGYGEGRDEPEAAREVLYTAFIAGFDEAGEGFNGEYVHEHYRGVDNPAFEARMREAFERWLAEPGATARGRRVGK